MTARNDSRQVLFTNLSVVMPRQYAVNEFLLKGAEWNPVYQYRVVIYPVWQYDSLVADPRREGP
jgi:hypothetical protein